MTLVLFHASSRCGTAARQDQTRRPPPLSPHALRGPLCHRAVGFRSTVSAEQRRSTCTSSPAGALRFRRASTARFVTFPRFGCRLVSWQGRCCSTAHFPRHPSTARDSLRQRHPGYVAQHEQLSPSLSPERERLHCLLPVLRCSGPLRGGLSFSCQLRSAHHIFPFRHLHDPRSGTISCLSRPRIPRHRPSPSIRQPSLRSHQDSPTAVTHHHRRRLG